MEGYPATTAPPEATSYATVATIPAWPREFQQFPNFPLEIRRLVWEHVCFQPRNIYIWPTRPEEFYEDDTRDQLYDTFDCDRFMIEFLRRSRPPSILHTSQEARKIGLEHYSLEFGTDFATMKGRVQLSWQIPPQIWVNWHCDTICLHPSTERSDEIETEVYLRVPDDKLRKLAVEYMEMELSYLFFRDFCLEELIVYWVPPEAHGLARLFDRFDPQDPFDFDFIPINDYSSHAAYGKAKKELLEAGHTIEKLIAVRLETEREWLAHNLEKWQPPLVKLMVLNFYPRTSGTAQ